jgi:hypothetical protein
MVSGKKAIGVVVLVAAMVFMQLVGAPTAMARSPWDKQPDGSIVMVSENGTKVRGVPCGESCLFGLPCITALRGCQCVNRECYKNALPGEVLPATGGCTH